MAGVAAKRKTSGRKAGAGAEHATASRGKPKVSPAKTKASSGDDAAQATGGRPVWTGNIKLALVSVPVRLIPATRAGARLSFHQVHKPSGKRVRYEKVVPGIGPVKTEDIVKGFEISKGEYVLMTEAEIDSVRVEARQTLDLIQFVEYHAIDPVWFDRPYFVVPDGDLAEEAYDVLRDALKATHKIGIGQFVMRGREYIAALKPSGRGFLLETLRFADEVRSAAPFFAHVSEDKPDEELLDLAKQLIARKSGPFDAKKFHDDYTDALKALIAAKRNTTKPVLVNEGEIDDRRSNVIDLVEALKRSVARKSDDAAKAPGKAAPAKRRGRTK